MRCWDAGPDGWPGKAAALAAATGLGWLAWRLRGLWLPFGLALVLAYLLEPAVTLLERRALPRPAAILAVYAVLGLAVAGTAGYVGPVLYGELQGLAAALPEQTRRMGEQTGPWLAQWRVQRLPAVMRRAAEAVVGRAEALLARVASRAVELAWGLVGQVVDLALAPVLAYYILKDREQLAAGLLRLVPARWQERAVQLALEVDRSLAGVVRGQLVVSACVGVLVAAGLAVLGVPYALLLGALTAALDLIPYLGPVLAGIPVVSLALLKSPWTALWALAVLVAANQVEGSVLQPRIMSRSVGLHPLAVIAAVLAGAELAGVAGMVLALPALAVARGLWVGWQRRPALR
ncbi:MAG TPA: AI-2E family transporter [Limnochordales bacterium]